MPNLRLLTPGALSSSGSQISSLVFFVFICVFLTVFPNGLSSNHFGVQIRTPPHQMAEKFGYSDAGSYLKTALELASQDEIPKSSFWIINLWPPGMPALEAVLLKVSAENFGVVYAATIAFLWSVLILIFTLRVLREFGYLKAFGSASLLMLTSPLQSWILGNGIFYAEGVSVAAYIFGLICVVLASEGGSSATKKSTWMILSGCSIAISAYFRSTFSTLELVMVLWVIFAAIALIFPRILSKFKVTRARAGSDLKKIIVGLVVVATLMEPWFQFTTNEIRGVRAWSVVSGNFVRGAWAQRSVSPDFLKEGGYGWACELNVKLCAEISNFESSTGTLYPLTDLVKSLVLTVLANPVAYLVDRFHFIGLGWFSDDASMGTLSIISGIVLLAGFCAVIWLCFEGAFKRSINLLLVPLFSFALLLPCFIGHVEPRYFIPLKLSTVILPWLISQRRNAAGRQGSKSISISKR